MDDLAHDSRALHAATQLGTIQVASGNPDGTGGVFDVLAGAWLPSRSRDDADAPDSGLVFLVLLATSHPGGADVQRGELTAPYLVAVHARGDEVPSYDPTPWSHLRAVTEHPTYEGALATFAARLSGVAVEALAEGHGL